MDMVMAKRFFNVMICFHDPTDNQPFISMDLHQVAMANTFNPLKLEHSQPEVGAKHRLGKIYLNPPPEKRNQRGIAWNLKRSPPKLERKIICT